MGIGFVLLIWAVLLGCAAVPVAFAIAIWSVRSHKRVGAPVSLLRTGAAAILPFVLLAYGGVAFVGYAAWCELGRQVDPGIGDGWMVPVGNDVSV
jgi:hypothetical protein